MLEVKNLVKKYQISKKSKTKTVTALNNVSITFPEKGLIFLLGKSGSGKSTLLNAIGGLDTFDSGEIIIKGKSSKNFTQSDFDSYRNTFIGFIFQEYNVLEEFTVAKNLELAIELQGKNPTKEEVDNLLDLVEMKEFAKRKPNQLSGGQKQRVAIARALIKNPEIIMADEPTGALDSNTGKQVMETLKKLSQEKLVIIVSHDREFAEIYGDRIVELKDGKIIHDVTKKEVEPVKTESGISIIDDDVIHIKKGQKITKDDLDQICKKILENAENSDTIISMSADANKEVKKATAITDDGNREVFKDTTAEDVKTKDYSKNDFKLIKSRLKFIDSFKMGASALKTKVGKLVFTILLSFVAFAMFGIIDTLSTFNRAGAVYSTAKEFGSKHVSIMKETKGEYSNYATVFTEKDINLLNEKFPNIKLKKIVNKNIRFGNQYYSDSYSSQIYLNELNFQTSPQIRNVQTSGMMFITENELSELGLTKVAGVMPTADNEICISKWQYDCIAALNADKVQSYNDILTTYNQCSISSNSYKIVGIIDDGKDMTEYKTVKAEELNTNYMLNYQLAREIDFGFTNMVYITENHYNQLLNKEVRVELGLKYGDDNGYSSFWMENIKYGDMYSSYMKDKYPEYAIENYTNNIYYKGGEIFNYTDEFISLADDEVIMPYYILNEYTGMNKAELKNALNSETPLIMQLQKYGYVESTGNWDYTTLLEYKVVGFNDNNSSYIVSANSKNIIQNYMSNDSLSSSIKDYSSDTHYGISDVGTFMDSYFNSYWSSYETFESWIDNNLRNLYMKNNTPLYDGASVYELKDNEVIMYADFFSNTLGTGEELHEAIDNGLTVNVIPWGQDEKTLVTLTVVGVYEGNSHYYINENTYLNSFKPLVQGFDYSIAILSSNDADNKAFIEYCETFRDDETKFTIQNGSTPILDQFGDMIESMAEVFLYVGLFFAVFAAFLLMNFITTSISYKRREIGILRALGARGTDVFGIFFNESAIIALINFLLASIATIVTCTILNGVIINQLGLDLVVLSVGIRQVALILGVSLLTAFIASLIPVIKISRKKPIDAINNR